MAKGERRKKRAWVRMRRGGNNGGEEGAGGI